MTEEKCAARVIPNERWGLFHAHRCNRKAGFGKDGLYCKQHAKQHPADDQETVTMYAARWEYSSFDVAACQVHSVTDKSLEIHSAKAIFGYTPAAGRVKFPPNGQWAFFNTLTEALVWVQAHAGGNVADLQSEIARIERNLEPVTRMLKIENLESRAAEAIAEARAERASAIKRDFGHEG